MNTVKILSCTGIAPALRGGAMTVSLALVLGGCASSHVQKGALFGALTGAALGTGVGYAISNEDLLGPKEGRTPDEGGDTSLPDGGSILAGLAIGFVTGAIVGAMVGHGRDDGYVERPPPIELEEENKATEPQARAPYLRGL